MDTFKLLCHVGYPKAGSTWFQRHVFQNPELGFSMPWGVQSSSFIEHVKVIDTFLFDEMLQEIHRYYDEGVRSSAAQGLVPVLSYENILVEPFGGKADRRESARRLKALFPYGRFLLVIREQKAIILSSYIEHLRRVFTTKIDRFMGFDDLRRPGFGASCPPEFFLYDRLIAYLKDQFGISNLLVLPIELMNSREFEERLYSFIGMPISERFRELTRTKERERRKSDLVFLRHLNYIGHSRYMTKGNDSFLRRAAYGTNIFLNPIVPDCLYNHNVRKLKVYIESVLDNFYQRSNQVTSQMIGIDLSKLGYR